MRVGVEVRVGQVGELAGEAVQLDDVRPLDLAEVGPAAALVDAQERLQRLQGAAVDVKVVRQELAHGGAGAGLVSSARLGGKWVVAVNMGSTEVSRFSDGMALLNYGLPMASALPTAR